MQYAMELQARIQLLAKGEVAKIMEPVGGICKPASWGGAPGSNHILSSILASKRAQLRGLLS